MNVYSILAILMLALVSNPGFAAREVCTPTYAVFNEEVDISVGSWNVSFHLLAVGCKESLLQRWPPKQEELLRELALELQSPHPVQILGLIRDHSPELRRRLVKKINKVLGTPVVKDVFLFDAKASEAI
jgi:hypothetical protein